MVLYTSYGSWSVGLFTVLVSSAESEVSRLIVEEDGGSSKSESMGTPARNYNIVKICLVC